jgi:hypothetical protein
MSTVIVVRCARRHAPRPLHSRMENRSPDGLDPSRPTVMSSHGPYHVIPRHTTSQITSTKYVQPHSRSLFELPRGRESEATSQISAQILFSHKPEPSVQFYFNQYTFRTKNAAERRLRPPTPELAQPSKQRETTYQPGRYGEATEHARGTQPCLQ